MKTKSRPVISQANEIISDIYRLLFTHPDKRVWQNALRISGQQIAKHSKEKGIQFQAWLEVRKHIQDAYELKFPYEHK